MLEDLFSRKIVGDEVHEQESGELAAELLQRTLLRENCLHTGLVLHSDNGAPMKSQTKRAKAYELGVTTSYSRPRVSNDNPFAESLLEPANTGQNGHQVALRASMKHDSEC